MENEDYVYDYTNYSNTAPKGPCDREQDNRLGAQLSVLYYFMFVFSFLGNGLVLGIIHRFERLTTVTNILLLNLVLSSLVFMSSLPFLAVYMQLSNWVFGGAMCKLVGSVYYLGYYSSVLFLTLLTFDRHLAVVYSLGAPRVRSRRYAAAACGVVWLVSGLACIRPMILHTTFYNQLDRRTFCEEHGGNLSGISIHQLTTAGFYLQLFLFLVFPLLVIVYCYVRIAITVVSSKLVTKFRTVRLISVIVVLFFACWTPFNVVLLLLERSEALGCEESRRLGYALQITRIITYSYFVVSPVFYTFVGQKFQNYFRQLMAKRFPSLKQEVTVRSNSSTKATPNEL
ncbi:C-C chemokine receptor type 3-like [Salarias fasciatus]|uniref:C-C chemokine receptor type 3-like n=1 Tax=Salarias fasciatus TaxID=181472 RepID=A0A672HB86_SALFA|nr:C-C chemokine receptor type 3-like [Salarias fasciatus]XP_029955370.1 C-C chemokine receptor type 3-like [Salarias fasciatus]